MSSKSETVIYENPLASASDLDGFICEGQPIFSFPQGVWRLENGMGAEAGQAANYVIWCPEIFPADLEVSWDFRPIREPGLAMFWFGATGRDGKDLFDPSLAPRAGQYRQYFDGDINSYHASYFRRKQEEERNFHTCNLRKSKGFHLVASGGDPLPDADQNQLWYRIRVRKQDANISFFINELMCYQWQDDGKEFGPVLGEGRIGFRQMAPLIAEYRNLVVWAL